MKAGSMLGIFALLGWPAAAAAQHGGGGGGPAAAVAPREATQFDFLIGQWDLVVRLPGRGGLAEKIHGSPKLAGSWKAWRGFDGWGIEDELRIVDASANPRGLSHTMRVYDPAAKHWITTALDVYRSRFATATAEWKGGEMQLSSRGTDPDGTTYLTRSRFYDISPASFHFQQDRSTDDGKSWKEGVLRIEAKRVAAAAPH